MTDPDETKRDAVLPHLGETAAPESGGATDPVQPADPNSGATTRVDAPTPPKPPKPKRVDSKAVVTIKVTLADGTVHTATTTVNTYCLMDALTTLLNPVQDKLANATCVITVPAIDGDDKPVEHTLYSGAVNDVAQQIVNNLLPEPVLVMELYRMMQQAISHSKMVGYIVTLLLPNQQPVLFSNVNPTLGAAVTPEDINMLVAQAVNSIADFKDKMRKAGHVFPEDPGTILTPGGNGKGLILPGRR